MLLTCRSDNICFNLVLSSRSFSFCSFCNCFFFFFDVDDDDFIDFDDDAVDFFETVIVDKIFLPFPSIITWDFTNTGKGTTLQSTSTSSRSPFTSPFSPFVVPLGVALVVALVEGG